MTGRAGAPPDDATRAQIAAADPAGSVWLAANAGSGKTRVLTQRVAWLLLDGAAPERILCLTYTKAAAGEMQLRLFRTLGAWAMLPDDDLRREITALGAARGTIPPAQLRRARTLFARAIETPGGLKIQTIHAFCAALLRRFPLEAGVSPAFAEMDETAVARLNADVLDAMALDPATRPLVDAVAARLADGEPSAFLAAVARQREGLARPATEARLRDVLGVGPASPDAITAAVAGDGVVPLLEAIRTAAARDGGVQMQALAARLGLAIPALPPARFELLREAFLTRDFEPRKAPVSKGVGCAIGPDARDAVDTLAGELAHAHARIAALTALDRSLALHAFGPAFVARVEARKRSRGLLDFDDLIARANHLLSTSPVAQWVLFKLDGGLDHILVDEAQDTSPEQWRVVGRLAAEFGAGLGARPDVVRTLFVVGDRKQSIYGFQGADLDAYERMRGAFAAMLPAGGPRLRDHALLHSFRSSPVILRLVDAVFAGGGGVGDAPRHVAHHADMPGRVDLWPAIEREAPDRSDRRWHDPVDRPARNDAEVVLASRVADAIHGMIRDRVPVGRGDARRPVRPGDILILLQRRRALFHHIVHACKARGLDLAGADRLALTSDLAVRDLLAALSWAAVPADDLSLAAVLRSPLCATSEAGLHALAQGRARGETLWHRVERASADLAARAMLADVLRVADVLRPFEMLQRILIRHDGRRRLLARLGGEAAEAIDALLAQALAYERLETPSLAGFLGWLASADVDVRRQAGQGSIRVMSVHGAKGLEAPVVILPETMLRPARVPAGVRRLPDGTVVWLPPSAGHSPATRALVEAEREADARERDRLLYVAMTRAESWLIAGAAGEVGTEPGASWHAMIRAGMEARGAGPLDLGWGEGLRLEAGDWSPAPSPPAGEARPAVVPDWLEARADEPPRVPPRISPSALPGAKALPGEGGAGTGGALARGTALHALLEHLPRLPRADWAARAPAILARAEGAVDDAAGLLAEARRVLDDPALAPLFAPDALAEVPFALPATAVRPAVFGTMDRVVVTPGRVTVVDFKSNALVPSDASGTPEGILAQLATYRTAARAIWPGRDVAMAVLWTRLPRLDALPHALLDAHQGAIDALALRP